MNLRKVYTVMVFAMNLFVVYTVNSLYYDIEGTIWQGKHRITEHRTSATAIQRAIELVMKTNFYYGSVTQYRYMEYRVERVNYIFTHLSRIQIFYKCLQSDLMVTNFA